MRSDWFVEARSSARARLFCFPYAGGGSGVFREWSAPLHDLVRVVALRPPGRESRFAEAPVPDVGMLADQIVAALTPFVTEMPFAFFGHSLGGLVAFEVARRLEKRGLAAPRALVISGCAAPTRRGERDVARLPREEFLAKVRSMAGTPPEVFDHPELVSLLLPMLRADFLAAEDYTRSDGPPLDTPLFVYGGLADEDVSVDALEAWRPESSAEVALRRFRGGHFFIQSERDSVLAALRGDLAPYLRGSVDGSTRRPGE